MTALLKVKEHHLPKCLGCHSFVETMRISHVRGQNIERRGEGSYRITRDSFDQLMDLFSPSDETIGSSGLTVREGAMLYHWWHRVNKGHLLITDRGDGSIARLAMIATRSTEEWIRREVHLIGKTRKPENEEIGEYIKYMNDKGGQKDRIRWVAGDPSKLKFMSADGSNRKLSFSMVFINSPKDIVEVTKNHWESLNSESMGDYETSQDYASISAYGGMMAFGHYEKDDTVTEWVDELCESGHAAVLERADSVVIIGRIHQTIEGV